MIAIYRATHTSPESLYRALGIAKTQFPDSEKGRQSSRLPCKPLYDGVTGPRQQQLPPKLLSQKVASFRNLDTRNLENFKHISPTEPSPDGLDGTVLLHTL